MRYFAIKCGSQIGLKLYATREVAEIALKRTMIPDIAEPEVVEVNVSVKQSPKKKAKSNA